MTGGSTVRKPVKGVKRGGIVKKKDSRHKEENSV